VGGAGDGMVEKEVDGWEMGVWIRSKEWARTDFFILVSSRQTNTVRHMFIFWGVLTYTCDHQGSFVYLSDLDTIKV
jgi:hypothetical protein